MAVRSTGKYGWTIGLQRARPSWRSRTEIRPSGWTVRPGRHGLHRLRTAAG
ncbi:hypothetical protein ACFV23_21905 [Streptomyces sp. NPDC059627]